MKIENLSVGLILKNYKELCDLLEVPTKTGNAKKSQMKEFERYFDYEKEKYSFIIKDIYKVPLPPNNNITQYIPMIEKLILHIIIKRADKNKRLYIRKNELLDLLSMINKRYSENKYKQMKLSKQMKIPKQTILDFYSSSDSLLKRNLETALNSLVNQSLIRWNYVFTVNEVDVNYNINNHSAPEVSQFTETDKNGDTYTSYGIELYKVAHNIREATKEETEYIMRLQRERLEEMGLTAISDVFKHGKQDYFYNSIYNQLMRERNISKYYNSYSIVYNYDHIVKQYERLDNFILNEEQEKELSIMLNDEISIKIDTLAKNRHEEALKNDNKNKITITRSKEKYIDDSMKLKNKLIVKDYDDFYKD